jgi:microcin C transport system substrate-binding protein
MKVRCLFLIGFLIGAACGWAAPRIIVSYALAIHGTPKYPAGFTHFDYVNPDAPKGGTFRLHEIGTYDSFNRYATRGNIEAASENFYDTLMAASEDESDVYYGLIAEKVEYPVDYTWIIFSINPKARNQDATPITADEVVFSFNKFLTEGVPQFRLYFAGVAKVEALDGLRVKFTLKKGNKALMVALANLTVLPKQYWEKHKLSEPLTEIPLGSGAYTVSDYKMGQYAVYERLKSYWGMDLPVNKGRLNFDFVRYDYYRDETVAFEAFKAGEYDFYQENVAKNWATLYKGRGFDNGSIIKEEIPDQSPQAMQALVFNIKRPIFQDRRVREALNYALDFPWMNKNLFYGQYKRTRSYFANTEYEARGLPGKEELSILAPIKDKIPPEVFTTEYNPPVTDGTGNIRDQIRKALDILKEAGWEVKNERLVNVKTGEPFVFELLLQSGSPSGERVAVPVKDNLARMGITMNIRAVDSSQFIERWHNRNFDMISSSYLANAYPSVDLKIVWQSDYINSTYNQAGVQDKAVDYLIAGIEANQENDAALLYWGRALDRVLTWNFYVIPEWYVGTYRIAYWNKFSRAPIIPKYFLGSENWWIDKAKEARLPKK